MEESIIYAKKYLEDILSFFGLNIDVHATSEDEVISLNVPSTHMNGFLIGQRGETVRALQYMVSTALKNNDYEFVRVNVDVADYKKSRQNRLAQTAEPWMERVKSTGQPYELKPMNPADRRIVHKVADEHGLTTESVGFGRDRYVIIKPADGTNVVVEAQEEPEEPETAKEPASEPEALPKKTKPAKKPKKADAEPEEVADEPTETSDEEQ